MKAKNKAISMDLIPDKILEVRKNNIEEEKR